MIGNWVRPAKNQRIAQKSFEEWNSIARRCPEIKADRIESWLRRWHGLSHDEARAVITHTGVMWRSMPEDFLHAVFGAEQSPARTALRRIKKLFDAADNMQCVPTEAGVMLKGRIVFSVIRPESDGIVITTTKVIATEPERRTATRVDHVGDEPLDESLISDLRAGVKLS
jgi:hypothetical protein